MTSDFANLYADFDGLNMSLVRMLLEERINHDKPWYQQDRASRLADILDGVADDPVPVVRLLDHLAEEVQGDYVIAFDLAGLMLDYLEVIKCALAGGARQ